MNKELIMSRDALGDVVIYRAMVNAANRLCIYAYVDSGRATA